MRHQLFTDFYGERKEGKKGEKKVNAMTLAEQPFLSRQGGGGNIIHVPGNIHVCPVTWEPWNTGNRKVELSEDLRTRAIIAPRLGAPNLATNHTMLKKLITTRDQ